MVDAGVLYQGRLEKYLRGVAVATQVARPFGLRRMLEAPTLETQRSFLRRIENPIWKTVAETLCRRSVLRAFSGDPGFFQYLPPEMLLHKELYRRIHDYLRDNLLRENSLLQIVFFGRYVWEPGLPVYLHVKTFAEVKAALERVRLEILTTTVDSALASAGESKFDAFSLSDISSYLDDGAHHGLFEHVLGAAARGARFCSRSNLHHRPLALEHEKRVLRQDCLERELSARDHSCVHDFIVGEIR
jgi:S-adenosylmethionine-diacylglycerol 3-amino-3-carboxypropyl transferase